MSDGELGEFGGGSDGWNKEIANDASRLLPGKSGPELAPSSAGGTRADLAQAPSGFSEGEAVTAGPKGFRPTAASQALWE